MAKAFESHQWAIVLGYKDKESFVSVRHHRVKWQYTLMMQDYNHGLLQLVLASITKRRILRTRETYSRLRIEDLATKVEDSIDQVSRILQDMVSTTNGAMA